MTGPCGWTPTFAHFSSEDATEWAAYDAATQTIASAAAVQVLWSSTGRQFGACPVIARPVLCDWFGQLAWNWYGAPWQPVDLGDGTWANLPAGPPWNSIDPTRARLLGPVNQITSVKIGNVVFSSANYRLDDGEDLVRTDGLSWPLWQDTSLPGTDTTAFVVNYTIGIPVPAILAAMAGTYALEFARATSPNASTKCRLPSRVKTITRQGVTIDMVDPTVLLEKGLTGLPDVDAIILALNPNRYVHQPRVLVPGGTAPIAGA